ncbi:MAG: T9SS type A sorting domain-containing protein [Bacteroidetes bacterium]|nr:T9SS type A sorting domain-containing protein [Bacteroidota bacterium]
MKKYLMIIIFIITFNTSHSQVNYFKYFDHSSHWSEFHRSWNTMNGEWSEYNVQYYFSGDTLINGNWFYKLYFDEIELSNPSFHINYCKGAVREDSLKKIYYIYNNSTTEIELYNFNLSLQDTIPGTSCILISIDTIYFGTNLRKVYHFNDTNNLNTTVYEGMGKATGFLESLGSSLCGWLTETDNHLVCYAQQDTTLQFTTSYPCQLFLEGLNNIANETGINIFPNPATNNLTIETPEKATLEIINIEGQLIKTFNTAEKQTTIDVADLSNGIYFIKAKTDRGVAVKKFIKE